MAHALDVDIAAEFLAQIVGGKNQRSTRVLLLALSIKIRRVADLRLDLFFAITEIIVGDDGHNHAGLVAAGELERLAVVVKFPLVLPAHPIAALAFGGLIPMRQARGFLRHLNKMRGENHAAGVAGPMFDIEARVVLRQIRIAAVAEDAFDEIQVACQVARCKETNFHAFLRGETGHFGTDNRAEQQRDEAFRRQRLGGGERKTHQRTRWIQREAQHFSERALRHADFVVGDRQAALGDVKNALGRAPVAFGIVQDAVGRAIGVDDFRTELVAVHRQ